MMRRTAIVAYERGPDYSFRMTSPSSSVHHLPGRKNLALWCLALILQAGVFGASSLAWQNGVLAFLPLLAVHAYASVLCWLLIHEAIHYKLAADRRRNDVMGRALAVLFGCPFHILKIGHMAHHRYNRGSVDTTELMPHDTRSVAAWSLAYYARILGLLYVSEVIAPLAFFFWRNFRRAMARIVRSDIVEGILDLFTRPMINVIRIDAVLCIGVFAVLIAVNRDDVAPAAILFFTRALIVSYYDNAYHYGTDPSDPAAALNLSVPGWLTPLILNHNMHRTHHRYPLASWATLPSLFARDGDGFDAGLLGTGLAQMKGPVRRPAPNLDAGT